jgi:putative transposase
MNLRESVFIRYSLSDLTKIYVYSKKGEFLCIAKQVEKVHPMANILGTVKDMEQYKQQYKKQQQIKNKLVKQVKATFSKDELEVLEGVGVGINVEEVTFETTPKLEKPKRERKQTPREIQMNRPFFSSDYEKYEWLMKNGCTNSEDRNWLTKYIRSDEYSNLYD